MEQILNDIQIQLLRMEANQLTFHLQMMYMINLINQNLKQNK